MADVTLKEAQAAAKRLAARSRDFQTLEKYLARKAGMGRTERGEDPYETYRKIGRKDQHRELMNLIHNKRGESE